jgi:cystathionine beta-lyase
VWNAKELEKIIEICIDNDVVIVSDEIHADIVYEKTHHILGSFEKVQKNCVILNAPSKTFNIAGLNTSYAIIPDEKLRRKYRVEQNRSGITNGNPFGIEALMAAYENGDAWLEALKMYLSANIEYVNKFIAMYELPIKTVKTEATFLIWMDCSKMGLGHDELIDFFVHEAKLGLNDGKSFGKTGDGFMRLNIGTSKKVLEVAMNRLLVAYKGKN